MGEVDLSLMFKDIIEQRKEVDLSGIFDDLIDENEDRGIPITEYFEFAQLKDGCDDEKYQNYLSEKRTLESNFDGRVLEMLRRSHNASFMATKVISPYCTINQNQCTMTPIYEALRGVGKSKEYTPNMYETHSILAPINNEIGAIYQDLIVVHEADYPLVYVDNCLNLKMIPQNIGNLQEMMLYIADACRAQGSNVTLVNYGEFTKLRKYEDFERLDIHKLALAEQIYLTDFKHIIIEINKVFDFVSQLNPQYALVYSHAITLHRKKIEEIASMHDIKYIAELEACRRDSREGICNTENSAFLTYIPYIDPNSVLLNQRNSYASRDIIVYIDENTGENIRENSNNIVVHDERLAIKSGTNTDIISNFTANLVKRIKIYDKDSLVREDLCISINVLGKTKEMHCDINNLKRLATYITDKNNMCSLLVNEGRANEILDEHIRKQINNVPKVDRYVSSGWQVIKGQSIYAHDGIFDMDGVTFTTGLTIETNGSNPRDAANGALQMQSITQTKEKIFPLITFAHMGILCNLFEEAGFTPRVLLNVVGETGSLKTALTTEVMRLGKNDKVIAYGSTAGGLQTAINKARDRVLIVDDFHPTSDGRTREKLLQNQTTIVRMYGDGTEVIKGTINSNENIELKASGLCALTGEYLCGVKSDALRKLNIKVDNSTYNGQILSIFQSDHTLWSSHMYHFIKWVEHNRNKIVEIIKRDFTATRNNVSTAFKERRLADATVNMILTSRFMGDYLVQIGYFSDRDRDNICRDYQDAIMSAFLESERLSQTIDPIYNVTKAISMIINKNMIKLASSREEYTRFDKGYIDEKIICFEPEDLYSAVNKYLSSIGECSVNSLKELKELLRSNDMLKISNEGKSTQGFAYKTSVEGKPRLIAIYKNRIEHFMKEQE